MDSFELVYKDALNELQNLTHNELNEYDLDVETLSDITDSSLDGLDYCFAVVWGIMGSVFLTNENVGEYLKNIHDAASDASGKYTPLQKFLGKLLHHKKDAMDTFTKRTSDENPGVAFHRLFWGHDAISFNGDNPFVIMYKQKGLWGIIQAVRHLIADTFSRQGLPLPGTSFFDFSKIEDGRETLSNHIKEVSQFLSEDSTVSARDIYSHLFTLRAQDLIGTTGVIALSAIYLRARKITDKVRVAQFKLLSYSISFFYEAFYGSIKQGGVPYINVPLGAAAFKELIGLYWASNKETRLLSKRTDELILEDTKMIENVNTNSRLLYGADMKPQIEDFNKIEKNVDELIDYLSEEQ